MFVFHFPWSPTALAEEEHQTEPRRVLDDVSQVHSDSLHNGALVFCNLGASSISDTVSKASEQQRGVHLHAAAPQDCGDVRGAVDLKACKSESHSKDITEISKDNTCVGHLSKEDVSHLSVPKRKSQLNSVRMCCFFRFCLPKWNCMCAMCEMCLCRWKYFYVKQILAKQSHHNVH